MIITRFAPSPTGIMHLGNARTALFSWLFARHNNGKFLLRIEDTDKARSTPENMEIIKNSLNWLGINWDDEIVYQSKRAERHIEIANKLLAEGKAYYCYTSQEELAEIRDKKQKFISKWRDSDETPPECVKPVVRFKTHQNGEVSINDNVQGKVTFACEQLEDMVLLRADGSPTFIIAVVTDDNDMGINHIIRGDDHLTNALKHKLICEALGWNVPEFSHVPMIHGQDGGKLSKRHGAVGVGEYIEMGILPEAMRNYLLRLGWSHGNDEIISTKQAIDWFNLNSIGKSPAKFDINKLISLNSHYIKEKDNSELADLICNDIPEKTRIIKGMDSLKQRANTIKELAESALFYIKRPEPDEKASKILAESVETIKEIAVILEKVIDWNEENIKSAIKEFANDKELKLGKVAQPIRALLTGSTTSPSVFEIMEILGKEESLKRL